MSLSIVISTYNREEKLKRCLESIKGIADEIIVVDNTSSDNSVALAKKYTSHVFVRKNNPMLNINKNFGFTKATKDWILYLDDDEELTPELIQEIENWKLKNENSGLVGYWIPRKNIIFGKWVEHTGWYPDYQMRLFKKGKGTYPQVHVHEMVQVDGEVGHLKEAMVHYNYASIQEFLHKTVTLYAPNEAQVLLESGHHFSPQDILVMPFQEFLGRYFAREGYRDGLHGLALSLLMSFYHLVVACYLWEKNGFSQDSMSLGTVEKQVKEFGKEWKYWMLTAQEKKTTAPLPKLVLRVRRKLGL